MVEKDIGQTIERLGPLVKDKLLTTNPILRPDQLVVINKRYKEFYPHHYGYRIWSSVAGLSEVIAHSFQHPKVVLLISGVATGGKDALREKMQELVPNYIYQLVTGTSREQRPGEEHKKDYYFYPDAKAFLDADAKGEFLEKTEQSPGRWYGTPKQSLLDALARPEPVVCSHVEMSAWPKVEQFIEEAYKDRQKEKPFVLKVFVMPEMTAQEYFNVRLPKLRTNNESRATRAGWELRHAPTATHFIITNVIDKTGAPLELEAKAVFNSMANLFPIDFQPPHFPFPDVSPGIFGIDTILNFQNRHK